MEEREHTRHVSVTTARVAGLSTTSATESATVALVATESSTVSTSLWAVTSDVANL